MGPCWRPDTEARVLGFLAPGHFEPSCALCSSVRGLPCTRSPGWPTVGFMAGFQARTARFGLGALGYPLVFWSSLWNVSGVSTVS